MSSTPPVAKQHRGLEEKSIPPAAATAAAITNTQDGVVVEPPVPSLTEANSNSNAAEKSSAMHVHSPSLEQQQHQFKSAVHSMPASPPPPKLALIPLRPATTKQQQPLPLEAKQFPIVLGRANLSQWWYQSCDCQQYYCRLHCRPVAQNIGSLSKVMIQIDTKGRAHIVGKNPHLVTIITPDQRGINNSNDTDAKNTADDAPDADAAADTNNCNTNNTESNNKEKDDYHHQPIVLRPRDILSIGRRDREPWMRFQIVENNANTNHISSKTKNNSTNAANGTNNRTTNTQNNDGAAKNSCSKMITTNDITGEVSTKVTSPGASKPTQSSQQHNTNDNHAAAAAIITTQQQPRSSLGAAAAATVPNPNNNNSSSTQQRSGHHHDAQLPEWITTTTTTSTSAAKRSKPSSSNTYDNDNYGITDTKQQQQHQAMVATLTKAAAAAGAAADANERNNKSKKYYRCNNNSYYNYYNHSNYDADSNAQRRRRRYSSSSFAPYHHGLSSHSNNNNNNKSAIRSAEDLYHNGSSSRRGGRLQDHNHDPQIHLVFQDYETSARLIRAGTRRGRIEMKTTKEGTNGSGECNHNDNNNNDGANINIVSIDNNNDNDNEQPCLQPRKKQRFARTDRNFISKPREESMATSTTNTSPAICSDNGKSMGLLSQNYAAALLEVSKPSASVEPRVDESTLGGLLSPAMLCGDQQISQAANQQQKE